MESRRGQIDPTKAAETNERVRNLIRDITPNLNGEYVVGISGLSYYKNRQAIQQPARFIYSDNPFNPFSNALATGRIAISEQPGSPLFIARLEIDSIEDIFMGPFVRQLIPRESLSPNHQFIESANLETPSVLYTVDVQMDYWSVHLAKRN